MISNSKGSLEFGLTYHFNQRIILQRDDRTKERDFELLRTANCRIINTWGKSMEDKGQYGLLSRFFQCCLLADKGLELSLVIKNQLRIKQSCPFQQRGGGQRILCVCVCTLAFSQLTLAQNNRYAKVAYFGVAYSAFLDV